MKNLEYRGHTRDSWSFTRVALLAVAVASFAIVGPAKAQERTSDKGNWHYIYNGKRTQFPLGSLVAVDRRGESLSALTAELATDVPSIRYMRTLGDGWELFSLPNASAPPALRSLSDRHTPRFWFSAAAQFGGEQIWLVPNRIFLKVRDRLAGQSRFIRDLVSRYRLGEIVRTGSAGKGSIVVESGRHTAEDTLTVANELSRDPGVEWAEPAFVIATAGPANGSGIPLIPNPPADPSYIESWGLKNYDLDSNGVPIVTQPNDIDIGAETAWQTNAGSRFEGGWPIQARVAVIDVGVESHPDLNLVSGYSSYESDNFGTPTNDCENHGTSVAGVAAMKASNSLGSSGAVPDGVVVPVRGIRQAPAGCGLFISGPDVADAFNWVRNVDEQTQLPDPRAEVINFSWNFDSPLNGVETAIDNARDAGIVVVVSAGNGAGLPPAYPAYLGSVLAVSNMARNGEISSNNSNWDSTVVSAPGEEIFTTDRQGALGYNPGDEDTGDSGDFTEQAGTSYAAPHVASVAALLLNERPDIGPHDVETIIRMTADPRPGWAPLPGYGLVKADAAMALVVEYIFAADFERGTFEGWDETVGE